MDYNESLSNAAAEHRLTGGLISVHNHNLNFLPSADDFRSQFIHSYDFGIVVCHDGKVIKYQLDEEKGDVSKIFEGTVAKSYKAHYNRLIESGFAGNAEQRAMMMAEQEAVEHLQAEYGLKYEVY